MEPVVAGILIAVLVLIILWPPFILVVLAVGIDFVLMVRKHNTSPFPPIVFLGNDPTSEVKIRILRVVDAEPSITVREHNSRDRRKDAASRGTLTIQITDNDAWREFLIINLRPGTRYYYKITGSKGKTLFSGRRYTFKTAPKIEGQGLGNQADEQKVRIVAFGDIQSGEALSLLESYHMFMARKLHPDLVLCMGDLVHDGSKPRLWQWFFSIARKLLPNTPFYTTPGNHCGGFDNGATIRDKYGLCPANDWFYSVRYGDVLIISVNSLYWNTELEPVQRDWMIKTLEARDESVRFTIVFTHYSWYGPPYRSDGVESDYERFIRDNWEPIWEKHGVDLVLGGHKHSYARIDGNHIVTASVHGVRKYPERREPDYVLQNRHHVLLIETEGDQMRVTPISWFWSKMDELIVRKSAPR